MYSMRTISYNKGFTVLEFLVVIGIMGVLVLLVLVGLTGARANAREQARVSNIKTIVVGLAQFHDICRTYPAVLLSTDVSATCPELNGKTLKDLVPDIDDFKFNDPASDYVYTGLADISDPASCIGFHIGVKLETDGNSFSTTKSGFGPGEYQSLAPQQIGTCAGGTDFEAGVLATDPIFDIRK